jgi:hypothetical protein
MPNPSGDTAAIELHGQEVAQQAAAEAEARTRLDRSTPESLADLFAPDIVLPEQFFEGARRDSQASGEKALMLAVLEDGIRCFQEHLRNPRSNPRLLSQQAEAWIRAVDYEWPFSFNNVCETLGIDPSALRAALLDWKTKRLAERGSGETGPTPTAKKVYRLHLRTKRTSGLR